LIPKATSDFFYQLPNHRIALYPLNKRDESKLLIYKDDVIKDVSFKELPSFLTKNNLLIFNKTKVVNARLIFQKNKTSPIEVFCIEPVAPTTEISLALMQKNNVIWKCLIGGARKWKEGKLEIKNQNTVLKASREAFIDGLFHIAFEWDNPDLCFSDILEIFGNVPLPPYIKRGAETTDKERYQTVYASVSGSVAAPTAGLHFTQKLIDEINQKKECHCRTAYVTLHVSAGTFKPLTTDIKEHHMHPEHISVDRLTLKKIKEQLNNGHITAIGTTSLRTLESLYWLGVQLEKNVKPELVGQFQPYNEPSDMSAFDAVDLLEKYMNDCNINELHAISRLMIIPGYSFKIVDELITNFHQPNSTLLALVSAFIGESWKKVYTHALENDYRFLSYGDGCYFSRVKLSSNQ